VSLYLVYIDRLMEIDAKKAMRSILACFLKRLVLAVTVVITTLCDEVNLALLSRSGNEMKALFKSMKLCLSVDAALHDALSSM
jgi:type III secretory pathway component EscT